MRVDRARAAVQVDRNFTQLRRSMQGAIDRCRNPNNLNYHNYGGRGVQFKFSSASEAARWILSTLGPRPSTEHSIDRIDNDRHYEAGNLRWATRVEQGNNKRAYRVGAVGERIRRLQETTYYCYETLRGLIKQGLSDDEIKARGRSRI